jgi:hypothetical protein
VHSSQLSISGKGRKNGIYASIHPTPPLKTVSKSWKVHEVQPPNQQMQKHLTYARLSNKTLIHMLTNALWPKRNVAFEWSMLNCRSRPLSTNQYPSSNAKTHLCIPLQRGHAQSSLSPSHGHHSKSVFHRQSRFPRKASCEAQP